MGLAPFLYLGERRSVLQRRPLRTLYTYEGKETRESGEGGTRKSKKKLKLLFLASLGCLFLRGVRKGNKLGPVSHNLRWLI